jgi:hypothetical protein
MPPHGMASRTLGSVRERQDAPRPEVLPSETSSCQLRNASANSPAVTTVAIKGMICVIENACHSSETDSQQSSRTITR